MENFRNMDFYVLPPAENCGYNQFCFGAGENHIRLTSMPASNVTLLFRYQGDASVIQLLLLTDALKRAGAANIDLLMPYFPGARQDRVCNPGEPLSVKVYASLINAQQFSSVTVFDPHSDVTAALLNKARVVKNHAFVRDIVNSLGHDITLISPDAGANKKIFELAAFLGGVPVVRADKIRDVRDGKIIASEVFADSLQGATCVIIDDICAGGRTFIELAKKLKEKGAEKIVLLVSHYEGTANEDALRQSGIGKVYCTDSLAVNGSEFVSVTAVTPFLIAQGEVK